MFADHLADQIKGIERIDWLFLWDVSGGRVLSSNLVQSSGPTEPDADLQ